MLQTTNCCFTELSYLKICLKIEVSIFQVFMLLNENANPPHYDTSRTSVLLFFIFFTNKFRPLLLQKSFFIVCVYKSESLKIALAFQKKNKKHLHPHRNTKNNLKHCHVRPTCGFERLSKVQQIKKITQKNKTKKNKEAKKPLGRRLENTI